MSWVEFGDALRRRVASVLGCIPSAFCLALALLLGLPGLAWAQNAIVTENQLAGTPASVWDVSGAGDLTIQGFATDISVNKGQTVRFKIKTNASAYHIDIYRLGYYQGNGARLKGSGVITATLPQSQPNPLTNATTGLIDCGNWAESAHWDVPANAVSGIYIARLIRNDTQGASHIVFIVRDDASHSALLFQTSDATWQAYNAFGGNSLYVGDTSFPNGHAAKVSYNRPFVTRAGGGGGGASEDWVFNAEYPMVRWLEANGYDVTYTTDVDTDRRGNLILQHAAFLSVGHDEYWSGAARANVTAARNAGVHLAFFSGNEVYWKTRYEASTDASSTPYRTLVCYKEGTLGENVCGGKCDPLANVWTGLWRDGCAFTPPADGCQPENALSGQISWDETAGAIEVPDTYKALRFWRNTSVATLGPGQTATLAPNTLGYEWNWEQYPGSYPPGRILMSSTTLNGRVHHLSLYRHASGALVFGAGTVQWAWGLDGNHDRGGSATSVPMQQATVNLLADMGAQPGTLQSGLVAATASTDATPPTSQITSLEHGAQVESGALTVISGTAGDAGGVVAGVEVSVDGGATWLKATGTSTWTYDWTPGATGSVTIKSRAFDDTGNMEAPGSPPAPNSITVTVVAGTCPCSIWSLATVPGTPADADNAAVELGVKFRASETGYITGIRYYKSATNTGVHVASLWTSAGSLLAQAPFIGESGSGWQSVTFGAPVVIAANTTYIASYHTNTGHYAADVNYFATGVDRPPLRALADGEDGANGIYAYSASSTFPTSTFQATNYWVDVVFATSAGPDTVPPTVTTHSPTTGATGVAITADVTAAFNEAIDPATVSGSTVELRDPSNNLVAASVSYESATATARLHPTSALAYSTAYTATLQGGTTDPRIKDVAGNALAADVTWSFTTTAPPPPPPNEGPGGPILVISAASNPFSRYFVEILRAEGLNEFTAMDLSLVNATVLNSYDVVILGEVPLTTPQVNMLDAWTNAGGVLIAMRPATELTALMGLTSAGGTLSNAYLAVNTATGPGVGIVGQTMQYHGTADRYTLNGATAVATLYSNATTATPYPAVTTRAVGTNGGQAIAFTYDLARSVVYTRQGNPAWAGQERDGTPPKRSDDMFYGAAAEDPQPDWVDLNKVAIPQADEQQRLLVNLVLQGNLHRKPLPRFWYFPQGKKAVVVMTGDNHGDTGMAPRFDIYRNQSPANCSEPDWECVRATGYEYVGSGFTDAQAQFYNSLGFEVAVHILTNCADWTPASLDAAITNQLATFTSTFPSIPVPTTNRTHCIAWSDWSSEAEISAAHGIRLDTNYYYWPPGWVQDRPGLFTGSGMPMRFAKQDGTLIDCYQAATQMTDESGQTYPMTSDSLLERALDVRGYYGAFCANMHFDSWPHAGSDAIVASAQARGVPVVSSKQMLTWLDGRNGSSFGNLSWSAGTLSFSIAVVAGAHNLRAMLPVQSTAGPLAALTRNGTPVSHTTETIKGIAYAFFPADPGNYAATYEFDTTPPSISGVTATPHTDGTATIAWTTNEASNSRVDYGTAPGSLPSNTSNGALVTSHSLTLAGLLPSTTYYYRVTSVDESSNSATSPNPPASPLSFTMPEGACFVDQTDADFGQGGVTNTYVSRTTDGEVILAPTVGEEFSGASLPAAWTSVLWSNGTPGGSTVAAGRVSVDGGRLTPTSTTGFSAGRVVEFVATFSATAFQHIGFGSGDNTTANSGMFASGTQSWAMFSTGSSNGPNLFARLNPGGDVSVGAGYLGAPHTYRIEWRADSVVFMIDGASVDRRAQVLATPMRVGASDFTAGGSTLQVEWVRMTPYATSGTFVSRVYDAGAPRSWSTMSWNATTPAGTSVGMEFRSGGTPVPDGSWTAFAGITSGGTLGVSARYIQYRAQLATANAGVTPALGDVSLSCCADATASEAISDLAAQQLAVDSNGDGTRQIRLMFSIPGDATSAEVYRARFGNYPEYDDPPNAGSVPSPPTYPPNPARWTLTGVTASGQVDEVAQRDEYYYAAFAKDGCGNVSLVSNVAGGTLNYVLGDVHDGQPGHECQGNNIVYIEDLSYLGSNYGATLAASDPRACLDVGPTVTGATSARPLTDDHVDFEDLIIFGLNFGSTPFATTQPVALQSRPQTTMQDAAWVDGPDVVAAGEEFTVRVHMSSGGSVHGVSAQLAWDREVADPLGVSAGSLARDENGVALSARPGNVDAARLGGGFTGSGVLAEVRFRARSSGNPGVRLASAFGRDGANRNITLSGVLGVQGASVPARTQLGFAVPNPFRVRLAIQLAVAHAQRVRLRVYDLAGRVVRTLVDGPENPGSRVVVWDGRDEEGRLATAGVYLLQLEANEVLQTRRVQLVR